MSCFEKFEISGHFEGELVVAAAEFFTACVVVFAIDTTSSTVEGDFISAVFPVAGKLLSRDVD